MAVDVIMPQMGESIFEGTITKWLKKPGDRIERDEPLFEISTDKVDAEIPAPSAGVLKEIKVSEGQTVPIQTVVAVIEAAGDRRLPLHPCSAPAPEKARAQGSGCASCSRCGPCGSGCRTRTCRARTGRRASSARQRREDSQLAAGKEVWRKSTTWISRRSKAAAPAGASARKTFWRRWCPAARSPAPPAPAMSASVAPPRPPATAARRIHPAL